MSKDGDSSLPRKSDYNLCYISVCCSLFEVIICSLSSLKYLVHLTEQSPFIIIKPFSFENFPCSCHEVPSFFISFFSLLMYATEYYHFAYWRARGFLNSMM